MATSLYIPSGGRRCRSGPFRSRLLDMRIHRAAGPCEATSTSNLPRNLHLPALAVLIVQQKGLQLQWKGPFKLPWLPDWCSSGDVLPSRIIIFNNKLAQTNVKKSCCFAGGWAGCGIQRHHRASGECERDSGEDGEAEGLWSLAALQRWAQPWPRLSQ